MNKKPVFEWIVISSKGEDLYLTEEQFKAYQEARENGVVVFPDFEINPSFVVKSFKRRAEVINRKYPCMNCSTNGRLPVKVGEDPFKAKECPVCHGTGVDFNYVPKTD